MSNYKKTSFSNKHNNKETYNKKNNYYKNNFNNKETYNKNKIDLKTSYKDSYKGNKSNYNNYNNKKNFQNFYKENSNKNFENSTKFKKNSSFFYKNKHKKYDNNKYDRGKKYEKFKEKQQHKNIFLSKSLNQITAKKNEIYLNNIKKIFTPLTYNINSYKFFYNKIKYNIKYKLISFIYISKFLLLFRKQKKTNTEKNIFCQNNFKLLINKFKIFFYNLYFNIKYSIFLINFFLNNQSNKKQYIKIIEKINIFFENKIIKKFLNINNFSNLIKQQSFNNESYIKNQLISFLYEQPTAYLNYDLNYYDFINQNQIVETIKEKKKLIKKRKKLIKGTGLLFFPKKFLTELTPLKKKLLHAFLLKKQKRKKNEIYGYFNTLETKPLINKGFIRPRKKMKKLGLLYYKPTRRNLKLTFVDSSGKVLAYYSCGTHKKFKKARRRLKDIRERTLFKMTVQIDDLKYKRIVVIFHGTQYVKVFKILKARRLKIIGYSYNTLKPHNGCRKPKKTN